MITYEEALAIARKLKNSIDACVEFDNAYVFKAKAEDHMIGGDGACCVLKKDGRAVSQTEFYDNYAGEFVREFDLK